MALATGTRADLLRRIGSQTRRAVFETEAAVEVEERVRKELRFGARRDAG